METVDIVIILRQSAVIQTPPPNRYPIQTEIHTFGAEIITDAINFEMSRNGQIYFVNNRISDLTHIAEMIHKYVPDARVAIGHGQMKPEELEKIILDFSNYDYDVLLSTTIVENGIDIPNANTIIINGAHNFGLSDLHQMRGRVGRGNRKAFCYLLAPPLAAFPADGCRRLEALEKFSDLGYETYQKILNQAMAELRNAEAPRETGDWHLPGGKEGDASCFVDDCALESDIEMYFPDQYVPSASERMLLYRELDNLAGSNHLDNDLEAYRKRLIDRFGAIPGVAEELINVVPLRVLGKQLGIEKIMLKQGLMCSMICLIQTLCRRQTVQHQPSM
jgi:transcription-repair coupling factor (superfamily II helicase)